MLDAENCDCGAGYTKTAEDNEVNPSELFDEAVANADEDCDSYGREIDGQLGDRNIFSFGQHFGGSGNG